MLALELLLGKWTNLGLFSVLIGDIYVPIPTREEIP